ncbi:MAG TPA: hypothetical protein VOA88_24130 [Candidatus Dormibacteraeota bacterium]|nr:hypothetical protein [Candidatus Dormibacteraeota bacterium]
MKMQRVAATLLAMAMLGVLPPVAKAQSSSGVGSSGTGSQSATHTQPGQTYVKPTGSQLFRKYLFDAFGPYALIGAAAAAGINQASGAHYGEHQGSGTPPEWGGGAGAYFQRFASNYGINITANTYRYGLGALLHEDTSYYRCECTGFGHRLGHALITTVEARHGEDGHYRFSLVNLSAPYAGTMTAALGWYPGRYEPSDGFRMGNYALATHAGINVAKEFIYGGPHTLVGHMHHQH